MNRSSTSAAGCSRFGMVYWLSVTGICLGLGGCVETNSNVSATTTAPVHMAARPGVSPRGAPVAIASIEGAPSAVAQKFIDRTRSEAAGLDIVVTDVRDAKYLVRGYLSAEPSDQGTIVSYVWDVYDSRRARVQRVEDGVAVKASSGDPWSSVDDKALTELAMKSAGDLAAVLSNMPEAVAAARNPAFAAPKVVSAPTAARLLSASNELH